MSANIDTRSHKQKRKNKSQNSPSGSSEDEKSLSPHSSPVTTAPRRAVARKSMGTNPAKKTRPYKEGISMKHDFALDPLAKDFTFSNKFSSSPTAPTAPPVEKPPQADVSIGSPVADATGESGSGPRVVTPPPQLISHTNIVNSPNPASPIADTNVVTSPNSASPIANNSTRQNTPNSGT